MFDRDQQLTKWLTYVNPLFRIEDLVVSDDLPRTASGKLMRRVLRTEYLAGLAAKPGETDGAADYFNGNR